jgi:hypothetical protein
LQFSIYRKPTQTGIIIRNSSCHPYEHKLSGINYVLNRLHIYPITKRAKEAEINTIRNILLNEYNTNLIEKPPFPQNQNTCTDPQHHKTKWATFTYSSTEVRRITKLFQDTQVKVAFCTQNTIQNILKPHAQTDKYNRSDIFHMKCLDCSLKYIRQIGRTPYIRYEEHIHTIRSNNSNSGYSNHILNTGHTYGTVTDTMDIINRKERQTFKYLRKILYLKNQ